MAEYASNQKMLYSTGFAIDDYAKFTQARFYGAYDPSGIEEPLLVTYVCLFINGLRSLNMYGSPWLLACLSIERFLMMTLPFWAKTGITATRRVLVVVGVGVAVLLLGGLYC